MNRIVREHYPVEKLPEDLRDGLPIGATVTVTVEDEAPARDAFDARLDTLLRHAAPIPPSQARARLGRGRITAAAAVDRIRALRDEWDD